MHPTIDLLLKRKSIRAYSDQSIAETEKAQILQATLRAPTAGNMMLYSVIAVEDQQLKDRLAITCDNQPFIAKAPWVLLFLADYQRWVDLYAASRVPGRLEPLGKKMRLPEEGDLLLACCDTLIAAHTAVIAAEALGIGSCYIGDILEQFETHRSLFNLPRYVLPITLICFGYPTTEQSAHQQPPRFDTEFIVHQNQYHRLQPADLDRMFSAQNARFAAAGPRQDGLENVGQFSYFKKFSADFMLEMSRSVRAMIKSWTETSVD